MSAVGQGARCTVLGASGFIGRHLVGHLEALGGRVLAPPRDSEQVFEEELGHVFYCIGLTADWRARPLDAVDAHVGKLVEILRRSRFESLTYLSSTRVYKRVLGPAAEDAALRARPDEPDDLFDLSKMLGETACLSDRRATRVARIANVYGDDYRSENFLSSILRDAVRGRIVLRTSRASSKDYVSVGEVVRGLAEMAVSGKERVYNLASGENTSNGEILDALARLTGCAVEVAPEAPTTAFPVLSVERARRDLGLRRGSVVAELPALCDDFRAHRALWERA